MGNQHGYFMAEPYTYGAYPETFPAHLAFLSLLAGHQPPVVGGALRVIEFGCGQGLNLCLQAALHPGGRFVGLDLNANHVAHGQALAAAAGLANVAFVKADLLALPCPLPPPLADVWGRCDIALAHGLLGWVSPAVGEALQVAAAAALRPGGLFYLSYNSMPGWVPELPFQHALLALERRTSSTAAALDQARELFDRLQSSGSPLFDSLPDLTGRLQRLSKRPRSYLLHEYGHQQWQPQYSDRVIEACAARGLEFLGTAALPEFFLSLLPEAQQALIRQQPDPALRQMVRDLLVNQAFRQDVYANGKAPLWAGDAEQALRQIRLMSRVQAADLEKDELFLFRLGAARLNGDREIFLPLMRRLLASPCTINDLQAVREPVFGLPELLPYVSLLIQAELVAIVPPDQDPQPALRLNRHLLERVSAGGPYRYLAATQLGRPLSLDRVTLVVLHALQQGHHGDQLKPVVAERLAKLRISLALESDGGDDPAALESLLRDVQERLLPRMVGLGVLESVQPG